MPCGIDTFGWTLKNRRTLLRRLGRADRARPAAQRQGLQGGHGDRRGAVIELWRQAAQAVADGFPETLPDGLRGAHAPSPRDSIIYPELPTWPDEDWAEGPLGPVYRASRDLHEPDATFTETFQVVAETPATEASRQGGSMRRYGSCSSARCSGSPRSSPPGAASAPSARRAASRSFARVAQPMRPSTAGKPATSLAQLRGVNFVSGCRFSHRNTDDPIVYPGPARQVARPHVHRQRHDERVLDARARCSARVVVVPARRATPPRYWVPTLIAAGGQAIIAAGGDASTTGGTRSTPVQAVPARLQADRRQLEGDGAAGR